MAFRILTLVADSVLWKELAEKVGDLHYGPDYARAYANTFQWEIRAAVSMNEDGAVLHPFVMRDIRTEDFLKDSQHEPAAYDLVQLYGFGGPILIGNDLDLLRCHWDDLENWAQQNRVATEYANIHPLIEAQKVAIESIGVKLEPVKDVVVWRLDKPEDPSTDLNRGHRSAIGHAVASGVSIKRVEANAANLAIFRKIYDLTMDRKLADDRWKFPHDYFKNLSQSLGPDRSSLFFAFVQDEVAAAYFLMHEFEFAYYHFGGSDPRFFECRANNLLMLESARWLKANGYSMFHLGGGVSAAPDDSLLRFKKGFTKQTARLYSYSRILHNELYKALCHEKRNFEIRTSGQELATQYFPLYRRKS